jgi:DNA-binding CsgD family transcriptional regulator
MKAIRYEQARELLRLVNEAHETAPQARAHHLIAGLRSIVGAASAGCVIDVDFSPAGKGRSSGVALAGWDDAALRSFAIVEQRGSTFHPAVRALMKRTPKAKGSVVTATRERLVGDRGWYGSPFVEGYLSRSCLDQGLFSSFRIESGDVVSGLGLYREKGDPPFSEADVALVELFHVGCGRMLRDAARPVDDPIRVALPRRAREALDQLLKGLSNKEIAANMEISQFTVNQYTKLLYRHFDVSSRSSLIALHLARK